MFIKKPFIQWGLALTTVLLFCLFVYLGFWQLGRATEKKELLNQATSRGAQKAISLNNLNFSIQTPADIRYQTLTTTGIFLNERTFLLDNQILKMNGQAKVGYQVITPFQPINSNQLILVNRGWIALGKNRETLPSVAATRPIQKIITLSGIINQPSHGLLLGHKTKENSAKWPKRIQSVDYNEISAMLKREPYPFLLTLKQGDPNAFEIMPLFFNFSVERHIAYAAQWFMMSLAILVYMSVVWYQQVRLKYAKSENR